MENLRYSGLIAGETSKAYDEIVTMNMVGFYWYFALEKSVWSFHFRSTRKSYMILTFCYDNSEHFNAWLITDQQC